MVRGNQGEATRLVVELFVGVKQNATGDCRNLLLEAELRKLCLSNQRLKLTGAATLVSRACTSLQAAPVSLAERSAAQNDVLRPSKISFAFRPTSSRA
jgi:hypothetical protein